MKYFETRLPIDWNILEFFSRFANGFFDVLFYIISFFGNSDVFVIIPIVIYFCINKDLGKKFAFVGVISITINNLLKTLFMALRPFQFEGHEHLRRLTEKLDHATGTSFPSAHSQISGTIYPLVCINTKKKWLKIIAILLCILVPISRLYLGVHFPGDVLIGFMLGIGLCFLLNFVFDKTHGTYWFYIVSGILFLLCLPIVIKNWNISTSADFFKSFGLFIGVIIGTFIEEKWVNFTLDVPLWKKLIRVALGAGVALGLKAGLKLILPALNICDFIRYLLMGVVAVGILPLAFTKEGKKA